MIIFRIDILQLVPRDSDDKGLTAMFDDTNKRTYIGFVEIFC